MGSFENTMSKPVLPEGFDHRSLSDDDFQSKLKEAMSKCQESEDSADGFKMTKEEGERIAQCFKEPEFKQLFHEYLDEMSDPKNREEMDTYIRQLEGEGQVPEGMCIPSEGLVAKAWMNSATAKDGKGSKVFINVTHTKEVEPASSKTGKDEKTGKKGTYWSIPFVISPQPKLVEDHSGEKVNSWDVCVNTETFETKVMRSKPFCDMLLSTAIGDIKTKFGLPLNDKDYKVLKNKKYMGGKPLPMNLKGTGHDTKMPKAADRRMGTADTSSTPDPSTISEPSAPSGPARPAAVPKGFMNKPKKKKNGPETPKFTVVHRGQTVLADCWTSPPPRASATPLWHRAMRLWCQDGVVRRPSLARSSLCLQRPSQAHGRQWGSCAVPRAQGWLRRRPRWRRIVRLS